MVDSGEKVASIVICWSDSGSILLWTGNRCKQHCLEGSWRRGIFGKCILSDILHRLNEAKYRGHVTYWLLSSGFVLTSAPLPVSVHLQEGWWKVRVEKVSNSDGSPIPSPCLPTALMQASHACFHDFAFLIQAWPFEKLKIQDTVNMMWFKTPLRVPALCWRCYKVPLEAGCLYTENKKKAAQGTTNKVKHCLLTFTLVPGQPGSKFMIIVSGQPPHLPPPFPADFSATIFCFICVYLRKLPTHSDPLPLYWFLPLNLSLHSTILIPIPPGRYYWDRVLRH